MASDATSTAPSLNQLRYLAVVVEEQSFTRAALRLAISQPALSRQIALLERRLRVKLLERSSIGVLPTIAGRALLPEMQALLALSERLSRTAREVQQLEAGVLQVATFPTLVTGTLLPAIRRWHEEHPKVQLRVSEFQHRRAMQEAVRLGTVDMAIGSAPVDWSGPEKRVGWNEMLVLLPPRDPLCKTRGAIGLEQLATRDWVLYDRAHGLSDVVTAVCLRAGFRPHGAMETSQTEAAARLAAAGIGVALVPVANVLPELAAFSRRLSPPVIWEIVAYGRSSWSKPALEFLKIAAEENHIVPSAEAFRWDAPR